LQRIVSVVGWFPLAGRTGRRELENQLSHWGRGSVRLRLQWIHSVPALLRYFILLSENRLNELQVRLERLEEQVKAREAAEIDQRTESDGFKIVRIQDLLAFRVGALRKVTTPLLATGVRKKLVNPLRTGKTVTLGIIPHASPHKGTSPFLNVATENARRLGGKHRSPHWATEKDWPNRKEIGSPRFLENAIAQLQQSPELRTRSIRESRLCASQGPGDAVSFPRTTLKSWTVVEALFNDKELETFFEGEMIVARIRHSSPLPRIQIKQEDANPVAKKMQLNPASPAPLKYFVDQQIRRFTESRTAFERTATMKLKTILHQGGWLTIRPIRALNLPDNFNGMFVRLRYGSEVLVTDSVDAKGPPRWSASGRAHYPETFAYSTNATSEQPNDLHFYVPPQQTNGLIRLSVFGERSQQQLLARTELGILYIPLGSAIAACIDCETNEGSLSPHYQRWFPLLSPRDAVPVEGDGGFSFRPLDSEKQDERSFCDYYMPCIELALIWSCG
jgi:hypothetical protein